MGTAIGNILEKERISLEILDGRIAGIDTHNMLYQFLSIIRGVDGTPLKDSKGRVTSHLSGLFYRTTNLVEKGIKPVFVFDGIPSKLKHSTLEKRHTIRTAAKKKFEAAAKKGDLEEARKFAMQAVSLDKQTIESGKELIRLMGFPVVEAPSEGEAQIASMVEKGKVDVCISQDYDALLFGAKETFRNVAFSGKRKAPGKSYFIEVYPEKIDLEKNLKMLGITREKLIWLGILVGTDFNAKFPKVGPKTALKLVKENDSFEDIIKATKYKPEFEYKDVVDIFLNPVSTEEYDLKFNPPNKEKIQEFLVEEHDFSIERVKNTLDKLINKLEDKGTQSRLGEWG